MSRRILSILATATVLINGVAAFAQAPFAPPGHPFFGEMDSNKDGAVTRAEVTAVLEKRFAALDTDRNGIISQAERQAQRDKKWDERFAAMDSDKNGQLSPAELRAAKDRKGTPGMGVGAPPPPPAGPGIDSGHGGQGRGGWGKGHGGGRDGGPRADRDGVPGGGDTTKEAFMKRALTRFDLLDSNDDGKITAAERDAAQDHRGFPGHDGPGTMPRN